jgi:AraC-like DNA-binding protein
MSDIYRFNTIDELNKAISIETLHPLISIVDFEKMQSKIKEETIKIVAGFYSVMFKGNKHCNVKYGRKNYDYQDGTILFFAPEQIVEFENNMDEKPIGWGLYFHPDLIRKSNLGKNIRYYSFFDYDTSEALHLSEKEKQILSEIINKIEIELNQNIDNHSQTLIVSNIELLLNYCTRYYDRQFITRTNFNKDLVSKLESILKHYFDTQNIKKQGLPTVKYCADKLNLSPNYLSDLLKKETGKSTQEHIHYYLIEQAKNTLLNSALSVSEIAYNLGFDYPQYFSKIFKKKTGYSPHEYRQMN